MAKTYSNYEYYYTSAQVGVYANGNHFDELAYIGWDNRQGIIPRYHYTDVVARRLRHGRKIVMGELAINYVHPMYLMLYLKDKELREEQTVLSVAEARQRAATHQVTSEVGPQMPIATRRGRALEQYGINAEFGEYRKPYTESEISQLETQFWQNNVPDNDGVTQNLTLDMCPPVDLIIKIGDRDWGGQYVHRIAHVKFAGPKVTVAPDGPHYLEVYQFTAKNFI